MNDIENDKKKLYQTPIFKATISIVEEGFGNILAKAWNRPEVGKGSDLHNVVIQTMCKLMLIFPKVCESHSRDMFSLVDSNLHHIQKQNIIISYADLLKRYPSSIETQIKPIFECLKSPFFALRKSALHLIVFLVLNDLIKLKSRITDIILMMDDPESEIRKIAKMFFYELHQKEPMVGRVWYFC